MTMTTNDQSLANIWDIPSESVSTAPIDRTHEAEEPLFLPEDADEHQLETRPPPSGQSPPPASIDAYFTNLDDLDSAPGSSNIRRLQTDAILRAAEARHQVSSHTTNLSSTPILNSQSDVSQLDPKSKDEAEKKEKKKVFRLDENLLLSPAGIPQLISDTQNFRVKGKGNELADLNRLVHIYQFWAHRMYPKTQFKDTIQKVEKICHSKRMNVALSVWRDEVHGISHQKEVSPDPEDEIEEPSTSTEKEPNTTRPQNSSLTQPNRDDTPASSLVPPSTNQVDDDDDDMYWNEGTDGDANENQPDIPPTHPDDEVIEDQEMYDVEDSGSAGGDRQSVQSAPQPMHDVENPEMWEMVTDMFDEHP